MQLRNQEHNDNQTDQFLARDEYHHSSVKVADAMMWLNRDGGGSLLWAFDGQSPACYGRGVVAQWAENGGIALGNYGATTHGGSYIELDGTAEYLSIPDASWQESTTYPFMVWLWCYGTSYSVTSTVAAKFDTAGGNWRSWRLWHYLADQEFTFSISATGGAGSAVDCISSYGTPAVNTWYFIGGYFQPSTQESIYVGAATDSALTVDTITSGIPASAFDAAPSAALTIGAQGNPSVYWPGRMGVGMARANVPATNIRSHMTRIFAATRWFYND